MRAHEPWCASGYRPSDGAAPMACDCGAQAENASQLAPQYGLKKGKHKTQWAGNLPDQFCVRCEGAPVKAVVITPKEGRPEPVRVFAACLAPECAHIRELEPSAVL